MARTPGGIGFEPAAGKDDALGENVLRLAVHSHDDADHARIGADEVAYPRLVANLHAGFFRRAMSWSTRPRPPPTAANVAPPQNVNLPSTLKAWRPNCGRKRTPCSRMPVHRGVALLDQDFAQIRIRAVLRDPRHVVEEGLLGVAAEIARHLIRRQIGRQRADILRAVVDEAHQPFGERAIAAALFLRRAFQQQDIRAFLARRQRGAQRCVSSADNDHIVGGHLVIRLGHARLLRNSANGC